MSDATNMGQELLDDFFAECAEQFDALRRALAALTDDPANAEAMDAAYRQLHSLKGNAGIVGLAPAEELAHAAEEILRGHSRSGEGLSPARLDALRRTAARLEEIVAAFRTSQPGPGIEKVLAPRAERPPVSSSYWIAEFAPTPERDRAGINVAAIRQRLEAAGAVLGLETAVQRDGLRFRFRLRLAASPEPADWQEQGVVWSQADEARPPAPAPVPPAAAAASAAPEHMVRVDLARLDDIMRQVGEMVVQRGRLADRVQRLGRPAEELQDLLSHFGRQLRDLRFAVTRLRMVPVAEMFARLPYVVQDLERDTGRRVRLTTEGGQTEIDKFVVERLKEPLLHLVRNAISHGLESPEERSAAGKPAEGRLWLRASAGGEFARIELEDDGRGVDLAAVARRAAAAGMPLSPNPDGAELLDVLCRPGFSTRDEATLAAGRGMGMDVVNRAVQDLGGGMALETRAGEGTRFTLRVPLSLSVADAFIVTAERQTCAIAQGFVAEIVEIEAAAVRPVGGMPVAPYRDGLLPLIYLRELFGASAGTGRGFPVLILESERGQAGLVVDRVLGHREIVVRPLRDPLVRVAGLAGATELGDGRPVLILDPPALLRTQPVRPAPNRAAAA